MKIPAALAKLGVTQAEFEQAFTDDEVDEGLNDLANAAVQYAKSISPVGRAEDGDDDPGAYRDAWHLERHGDGFRVVNDDIKAYWVEFGSIHNTEHAVAQRTAEHFGGSSVSLGGALADERIMNAQGDLRVALSKHRDLVESGASGAKLVESQERTDRARRQRSSAFNTARQRRYRGNNAAAITERRRKRRDG